MTTKALLSVCLPGNTLFQSAYHGFIYSATRRTIATELRGAPAGDEVEVTGTAPDAQWIRAS